MSYKDIKLHKIKFIVLKPTNPILDKFKSLFKGRPVTGVTPVELKNPSKRYTSKLPRTFLRDFLKEHPAYYSFVFGSLSLANLNKVCKMHSRRLHRAYQLLRIYYLIMSLPVVYLISFSGLFAIGYFEIKEEYFSVIAPLGQKLILAVLFFITFYLFVFIIARTALKIANTLILRPFADSICALSCAYTVIRLSHDDVLIDAKRKANLIAEIEALAQNTLALGWLYSSRSDSKREWSSEHFRYMERYIQERARWAIVPMESTLEDLRKDFYGLVQIYLLGTYGNFDWVTVKIPPETPSKGFKSKIFNTLPKLTGIILPIFLFGLLLWKQSTVENMGIGINIVALILISWFLLAVDAALKLGVVSGAVNLAKEIRGIK